MPPKPLPPTDPGPQWSLRLADQKVAAAVLAIALAAIGWHWYQHQKLKPRLIDIDRTPVLVAEFKIDINTADWPEFALLPSVGEVMAKRIVEDREQRGPFRDWNDLRRVRGVGPKTFEQIKPYLLPMADLDATAGT